MPGSTTESVRLLPSRTARDARRTLAIIASAAAIALLASTSLAGAGINGGVAEIRVNPGGGTNTTGSDGLRLQINMTDGGEQHVYRGQNQHYSNNIAPKLNIGGQLFSEDGPGGTSWTSRVLVASGGSTTQNTSSTATGSGSFTIRYTAVRGGRSYLLDRTVNYTYPNDYYTQTFDVTIPSGNTDAVKLFFGGDTAPGGSDSGYGIMLTAPVRAVISLNTSSFVQLGYREAAGSVPFDGATSQSYSTPYSAVTSGGNIGFVVTASTHDAGLMVQWNLGSTPGTMTRAMEVFANQQGVTLSAAFRSASVASGTDGILDLNLVNTNLSAASARGYVFNLPAGLTTGATATSNTCGGTLTAAAGSNQIVLSGASVAATANCLVSVPVTPAAAGAYVVNAASVSSNTGLINGVGTSTLTVTGSPVALSWADQTLVDPTVGFAYNDSVQATGSPAAIYSVSAGTLPVGLSLDPNTGGVVGTPGGSAGATYNFTISAANGSGPDISAAFSGITARPPTVPGWTDTTIAPITAGTPVNDGVAASGFPAPTFTISAGTLPPGLLLNSNTGAITGTPTDPAGTSYSFTVRASNGVGSAVLQAFSGNLGATTTTTTTIPPTTTTTIPPAAPQWTDTTVATIIPGVPVNDGVAASGFPAPTFTISAGALPPGLTLDPNTGVIAGVPTDPVGTSFSFTIRADNGVGSPAFQTFSGTLGPPTTSTTPQTVTPQNGNLDCPTAPIRVTKDNREGSNIAWFVCKMHLVGGPYNGEPALVLVPRGWFPCPNPADRRWLNSGFEFGGWLLEHYCGYQPVTADAWFGPWFAWDPPTRTTWWTFAWAESARKP